MRWCFSLPVPDGSANIATLETDEIKLQRSLLMAAQ